MWTPRKIGHFKQKKRINNNWLIEIDENSQLFKSFYHKKKENFETSTKTIKREFEAVKHIAYALYMIGDKPEHVSQHDYISFEEFDVKNYKSISDKAWSLYTKRWGVVYENQEKIINRKE